MTSLLLALASASPRRLDLLRQIGVTPHQVVPTDIDKSPMKDETPRLHAMRLAQEKAAAASGEAGALILAADTVVGVGTRILPKTETEAEARYCFKLLSGRAHRVYTAVALRRPDGQTSLRCVEARLRFKRLSPLEVDRYISPMSGAAKRAAMRSRVAPAHSFWSCKALTPPWSVCRFMKQPHYWKGPGIRYGRNPASNAAGVALAH